MKAISLWQPWATLVALGAKRYETRGWSTPHRGPLAIHAAKTWNLDLLDVCLARPFRDVLGDAGYIHNLKGTLPFGAVVCVVDLVEVLPIAHDGQTITRPADLTERELAFGLYRPGRYAWRMDNVRRLSPPLPINGRQQFFDVPDGMINPLLSLPAKKGALA